MELIRKQDLDFKQLRSNRTGEEFSLSAVLSADSRDFFIHVERIESGRRTSSAHFHRSTEEIVFVLSGVAVVAEGSSRHAVTAGDAVRFEANSQVGHFIENTGDSVSEVLVFSRRLATPDVVFTE